MNSCCNTENKIHKIQEKIFKKFVNKNNVNFPLFFIFCFLRNNKSGIVFGLCALVIGIQSF